MKDEKIRVGIIGLGFIGKIHAMTYHALPQIFGKNCPKARIAAVLRTHTGDQKDFLDSLGSPLETTRMEEFLGQDLDLVDICSPNFYHQDQVINVLHKKPHIYCEKPLGFNLEHARRMTAAAEIAGVLTHTAFTYRYLPAVWQAKAILASGMLGEIFNFRAHYFHNSYMDPLRPISWRLQKAIAGGGALADLGIHIMDMTRFLLGDVDWIRCNTRTFIKQRPAQAGSQQMANVDVDDWANCMLRMKNGAVGALEVTRLSGGMGDSTRMEIFGSRGSVIVDIQQPEKASFDDQYRKRHISSPEDFPNPPGERPLIQIYPPRKLSMGHFRDSHTASIMDFLLNIQEKKESSANFRNAEKAQEILEAAYLSAQSDGEKITLPLP